MPGIAIQGWADFSSKPIRVRGIPGMHQELVAEPNVQILAKRLKEYLSKSAVSAAKQTAHK